MLRTHVSRHDRLFALGALRCPTIPRTVLSLAAAVACAAAATPAHALLITSESGVTEVAELDTNNNIVTKASAPSDAALPAFLEIPLGDGTNVFGLGTFSQAFTGFRNDVATFWIAMNADNLRNARGIGSAVTTITYTAVKKHGDTAFVLHVTGGAMRIVDPDGGSVPELASVTLDATVKHGQSQLTEASANAILSGNGGSFQHQTFNLDAHGIDFHPGDFFLEDDGGNNVVAADVNIPTFDIPLNLANIVDGTELTIDISLAGIALASGGETEAQLLFRDPAHADDPDPFAGGPTVTFETVSTGPVADLPEPSSLALLVPPLLAAWCWRRRQAGRGRRRAASGAGVGA